MLLQNSIVVVWVNTLKRSYSVLDAKKEAESVEDTEKSENTLKAKSPGVSEIKSKISTASVKSLQKLQQMDGVDTTSKQKNSRICLLM